LAYTKDILRGQKMVNPQKKAQAQAQNQKHVYDFLTEEDTQNLIELAHNAAKLHFMYQGNMVRIREVIAINWKPANEKEFLEKKMFLDNLDTLIEKIPDPYGILIIAGDGRPPFEAILIDDWPEDVDEEVNSIAELVKKASKIHFGYQLRMYRIFDFFRNKMNELENEEDKKILLNYLLKLDKLIIGIPSPNEILRAAKEGKIRVSN
jgi:hypothetical protein